jgi:hypothetical protein
VLLKECVSDLSLLYQVLGTNVSNVKTMQLEAWHRPNDTDMTNWHALTTWVAYIPTDNVQTLRDMVKDTSSKVYTGYTMPIQTQLANLIDPTFDILSTAGLSKSAQLNAVSNSSGNGSQTLKNALIGVCTTLGAVLIAVLAFIFWRKKRNAKRTAPSSGLTRAPTVRSFGLRETWAPSIAERERVMNGTLAETWSHHDEPQMSERVRSMSPQGPQDPFQSPADPFVDGAAFTMAGAQHTERSNMLGYAQAPASRSVTSLTPSQMVQLEYEEQHGMAVTTGQTGGRESMLANRQSNYGAPAQYTPHHTFEGTY